MGVIRSEFFALILLICTLFIGGCKEPVPPARTSLFPTMLPPTWKLNPPCDAGWPDVTCVQDTDGSLLVIPQDSAIYVDAMNRRNEPHDGGISACVISGIPPAIRIRPGVTAYEEAKLEAFIAAPGKAFMFTGAIVKGPPVYPDRRRKRIEKNDQENPTGLTLDSRRVPHGMRALKIWKGNPDSNVVAIAWSDEPPVKGKMLLMFDYIEYPGEEFIQLFDPYTGKVLGDPIKLEGRRGSGQPTMFWSPDGQLLIVTTDYGERLWVIPIEELRKSSPPSP